MFGKNSDNIEKKMSLNTKHIRKAQGMTQKNLADELGIIEQTVSKIERGVFTPSADTIIQVCDVLNITPNKFMLNNPANQQWQSERLEHSINGLADQISTVQNIFAKTDIARDAGNEKMEKEVRHSIIKNAEK